MNTSQTFDQMATPVLIERLRSEAVNWSATCGDLFGEAADTIEELLAAAKLAVDALKNADGGAPERETGWASDESCEAYSALWNAIAKAER